MNARGTRRPHSRRVRSKPVRVSKRAGNSSSGCVVVLVIGLAMVAASVGGLIALLGRAA